MKRNIFVMLLAIGLFACGENNSKKGNSENLEDYTISKEQLEKDTNLIKKIKEKAEAAQAAGKVPFENDHWSLDHFVINGKKMNPSDVEIHANFSKGRLEGKSGCNNYFAAYSADTLQQSLKVMGLSGTKTECPNSSAASQERRYQNILRSAKEYAYDGKGLRLISENGELYFIKEN